MTHQRYEDFTEDFLSILTAAIEDHEAFDKKQRRLLLRLLCDLYLIGVVDKDDLNIPLGNAYLALSLNVIL